MITQHKIISILQTCAEQYKFKLPGEAETKKIADTIVTVSRTYTSSRWLEFDMQLRKTGQTTDTYLVYDKSTMLQVGIIKWQVQAKCYCFSSNPDYFFDATRMEDITTFIHDLMTKWRITR